MPVFSDTPTKHDRLDRRPFAREIAKNITKSFPEKHESIVFGLTGEWGSGKSTLLGFLKDEIEKKFKKEKVDFISYKFNPWMFSGQENLQREFLEGLLEKIKDRFHDIEKIRKKTEKMLNQIRLLKLIPKYGKETHEVLEEFIKGAARYGSVEKLKKHVDKALIEQDTKLLIFIDDIDRLLPNEITEIFQLVKLNSNFKNTFYFLAFDKEVVKSALTKRYGKNSERYLEKIVQVDYNVPEIHPEKREEIFFEELKKFFQEVKIDYNFDSLKLIWQYENFQQKFRNLRDVYRFINSLYFRLPGIWKEINVTDFLLLEAVRIFDFDGYQQLYQIGRNLNGSKRKKKENFKNLSEWTQDIADLLFRKSGSYLVTLNSKKGFSDPKYFEKYFSLQLSNEDFSVIEFERFLNSSDYTDFLKKIAADGRLEYFLQHFVNVRDYKSKIDISIARYLDSIFEVLDDDNLLRKYFDNALYSLQKFIGKAKSRDYFNELEVVVEVLIQDKSKFSNSRFIYIHYILDRLRTEQKVMKKADEIQFYKKQIQKLEVRKDEYLEKWVSYIFSFRKKEKSLFVTPLFFNSYRIFNEVDYLKKMEEALENEILLVYLVNMSIHFESTTKNPITVIWDSLNSYLPAHLFDLFIENLKNIADSILNKRDREYALFLLDNLDKNKPATD